MSSAQEPHPIISHLEIIEQRLGNIEKALGIDDKPKTLIRKRTMIMIGASLIFISGLMFGVNYVLNELFAALPV